MCHLLVLALATVVPVTAPEVKVMTYNVRFATAPDGENAWPKRREALIGLIKRHDPDLLAVQRCV